MRCQARSSPLKLPNPRLSFEGLLSQSFDHTCREHGNLARLAADDPPGELQGAWVIPLGTVTPNSASRPRIMLTSWVR